MGALQDDWGNLNGAVSLVVQRGAGGLYAGPAQRSTLPAVAERSTVGNNIAWQSHLYDWDSDLILARARVLDPRAGLMLQRDPIAYVDSVNLYAPMRWDPINVRDPTGMLGAHDSMTFGIAAEHRGGVAQQHRSGLPAVAARAVMYGQMAALAVMGGVASIMGSAAALEAGSGGTAAYLGLSGGLQLSAGVAETSMFAASMATGDERFVRDTAVPIAFGSGVGPLVGGTAGALAGGQEGFALGVGAGALAEAGAVAAHAGARSLNFSEFGDVQIRVGVDDLPQNMRPNFNPEPVLWRVDPEMRKADEAAGIVVNGVYLDNPTARPLSSIMTPSGKVGSKRMSGQFMFVVDQGGDIIIGTRAAQRMPHPTLVGGANPAVRAAGIVDIRGGRIYSVTDASGHFRPGVEGLDAAQDAFGRLPASAFHKRFQGFRRFDQ